MREKYKISEIAKIFNISRRTLIYYDEIDLLNPHYIDKENGYRYYSGHQIYILRFIIALKKSGFSLAEIKKYTTCKNIEDSQEFLDNKVENMEEKIRDLKKSIEVIKRKSTELEKVKSSKGLNPSIVKDVNLKVIMVDVEEPYRYMQVEKAFKKLAKIEEKMTLKERKHIAVVDNKNFKELNIDYLKAVGSIISEEIEHDMAVDIIEKKCVGIMHKDSFESVKNSYKKIMKFIDEKSYKIIGDAIEVSSEEKIHLEKGVGEVIEILIPIE